MLKPDLMHIVMGASGRVGSTVAQHLLEKGELVKGITRNEKTAVELHRKGMGTAVADAYNAATLTEAFKGGDSLFIITPETGQEEDVIASAKQILDNYRKALETSGIHTLVAISSMGAQFEKGTGNLQVSYLLEHSFTDLPVKQVFIRPAYYFSNWMEYLPVVKDAGVLPSFLPANHAIPMAAPEDVGKHAAEVLMAPLIDNRIYELQGPQWYTAADVAAGLSAVLHKEVKVQEIPRDRWGSSLKEAGLSSNAVENFIQMTETLLDKRTLSDEKGTIPIKGTTTLQQYLQKAIQNP